jgi:hypothetical protein
MMDVIVTCTSMGDKGTDERVEQTNISIDGTAVVAIGRDR